MATVSDQAIGIRLTIQPGGGSRLMSFIKVRGGAIMTTHIDMDIELDRLKEIGFPDEVWKTVHHNVRRGTQGTTMETMRPYRPGGFRPDGNKDRLVGRLKWIMVDRRSAAAARTHRCFKALTDAALLGIPPIDP